MPYVIAGLVAAGGLAAALSTADGLLLAIANALSHDIYYKMIAPNSSTATRLVVSRILLVVVAVAAAYTASTRPVGHPRDGVVGVLAGGRGHLPGARPGHLVEAGERTWLRRRHDPGLRPLPRLPGGVALLPGLRRQVHVHDVALPTRSPARRSSTWSRRWRRSECHGQAWCTSTHPMASKVGWFGVNNISCGLFSIPVGFITIWIVSLLTPAPSQAVMDMVDATRQPKGEMILKDKDAAVRRPLTGTASTSRQREGGALTPPFLSARTLAIPAGETTHDPHRKLPDLLVLPYPQSGAGSADLHADRPLSAGACSSGAIRTR